MQTLTWARLIGCARLCPPHGCVADANGQCGGAGGLASRSVHSAIPPEDEGDPGTLRRALGGIAKDVATSQPSSAPPVLGTLCPPSCLLFPLTGRGPRAGWARACRDPYGATHLAAFLGPAFPSSIQVPGWQTHLLKHSSDQTPCLPRPRPAAVTQTHCRVGPAPPVGSSAGAVRASPYVCAFALPLTGAGCPPPLLLDPSRKACAHPAAARSSSASPPAGGAGLRPLCAGRWQL